MVPIELVDRRLCLHLRASCEQIDYRDAWNVWCLDWCGIRTVVTRKQLVEDFWYLGSPGPMQYAVAKYYLNVKQREHY